MTAKVLVKGQQDAPGVVRAGAGVCWGEKPGQFVLVVLGTQKQNATTARALHRIELYKIDSEHR